MISHLSPVLPRSAIPVAHRYRSQRAYVAALFEVLGRVLVAAAAVDPFIRKELADFPDGHQIGFSVLGESLSIRVTYRGGRLVRTTDAIGAPDVEVAFKHLSHAFATLSFRENASVAFANDRIVTRGDVALTMRFVRCLERAQAVMLPDAIAIRALKSLPGIPLGEKLRLSAQIVARMFWNLWTRSAR